MGRIPIDLNVDYQRNPEPTAVPAGFGMSRLRAAAERGQVIAGLGAKVADIATHYAAQNKQADLRADGLKAEAKWRSLYLDARRRSAETMDPEEVNQIWADTHNQYIAWIGGKSDEPSAEGVPNIRWSDQKNELMSAAEALQMQTKTFAQLRVAEIGKHQNHRIAAEGMRNAENMANNDPELLPEIYRLIESNADVFMLDGTWTPAQRDEKVAASKTRADMVTAKINVLSIEAMAEPAKADEAAKAFETGLMEKEKDGSWAAFEHIPEADRKTLVMQADKAALNAKKWAEQTELERYQTDFFEGTLDEEMTADELAVKYPNLSPAFKASWKSANNVKKEPVTIEGINQAFEMIANAPSDPKQGILLNHQLRSMGFNESNSGALFDTWKAKYDPQQSKGSYTNEKSISTAKITNLLVTENERGRGRLFHVGSGGKKNPTTDKLSEFNAVLAKELDFYETYTKELMSKGKSWPEADASYWELPKIKKLTDEKSIRGYLTEARAVAGTADLAVDKEANATPKPGKRGTKRSEDWKTLPGPTVEDTLRMDYLSDWRKP
jgi:hypothetical protein